MKKILIGLSILMIITLFVVPSLLSQTNIAQADSPSLRWEEINCSNFTISIFPSSQSITQGNSATYMVTLTPQNDFGSSISLSASNLPPGATYSFNPSSLTPKGSSTLTINTSSSTPVGTYTITITATGGGITHTENIKLIVKNINLVVKIVIILQPGNPYMTVNGIMQEIDPGRGTKPVIIPKWGRTVVPIRAIVEALGGTIGWDGTERKVTINFEGTTIELWIDNPKARVNGQTKWIDNGNHDVKPIIINSRTMAPIRFIGENLGLQVLWDNLERKVTLIYSGNFILNYKNEVSINFKVDEKGLYKLKLKNPFNKEVKIILTLDSINKPRSWFSEFCVKNICFFNEAEIDLKAHEEINLEIYFYIKERGFGEFIFCLKYLDNMECIKFNINGG